MVQKIVNLILKATQGGKIEWRPMGEPVLNPQGGHLLQAYSAVIADKLWEIKVEIVSQKVIRGFLRKKTVEVKEIAIGIFVGGKCIVTSDKNLLPGKLEPSSSAIFGISTGMQELMSFLLELEVAIDEINAISVLDDCGVRLLAK